MKTAAEILAALKSLPADRRTKLIAAIKQECAEELLTDAEAAAILRIKPYILAKHLHHGPPRGRNRNVLDVRLIRHIYVGGKRRWLKQSVLAAISGVDE